MRLALPTLLVVSLLAAPMVTRAQSVDPSGHWEGTIAIPGGEIPFQVDLAMNARGKLAAAYSRPEDNLKGMPMINVSLVGRAIGFDLPLIGGIRFQGILLADGKSISGDVTAAIGTAPFNLTRTGGAGRIGCGPGETLICPATACSSSYRRVAADSTLQAISDDSKRH